MGDNASGYAIIAILVVLSFTFQTQMKLLAVDVAPILARSDQTILSRVGQAAQVAMTWRSLVILAVAATMFVLWFLALTKLDLSVALPLASIALVVNAVGGGLLLGEPLTWMRILGSLTVAVGVGLVVRS